ncbi:MAG TPA: sarcosine oxidase subunit gamma family protein [Usitatibacter sp.]|jgi:sarcosine oxidase subunit gamma|nr:sarcosine oxidase subunit gamma family protein [Usitatibacter sp.]
MNVAPLTASSAFAGLQMPGTLGIDIRELDGLGIATVVLRKGQSAALASRLRERYGIELPLGPRLASAKGISLLGTGPDTRLAIREGGGNEFALSLRDAIDALASVADQSDGLAVVQVSGARVREALCQLFAVDLDGGVFQPGDVAVTPAGHIGATLWRVDDLQGVCAFRIAVPRSFAASFRDHLVEAAASAQAR